jgi:hypothetical protein
MHEGGSWQGVSRFKGPGDNGNGGGEQIWHGPPPPPGFLETCDSIRVKGTDLRKS